MRDQPDHPDDPVCQYPETRHHCRTADAWTTDPVPIQPTAAMGAGPWGSDNLPFIGTLVVDPTNPGKLYVGTNYLWRYDESVGSWTPHLGGQVLASGTAVVTAIAVAPSDGQTIYTGSSIGELWMFDGRRDHLDADQRGRHRGELASGPGDHEHRG